MANSAAPVDTHARPKSGGNSPQGPARNAHRIAFAELEAGAKHVDACVVDDLEGTCLTPCTGMLLGIDIEAFDGQCCREVDVEGRAFAGLGVDADGAAHSSYEFFGDVEA